MLEPESPTGASIYPYIFTKLALIKKLYFNTYIYLCI